MREIPILFSTEMVKAILAGRKTQTRRMIDPQPIDNGEVNGNFFHGKHKGYVKVDGHPNWQNQFAYEFAKWKIGDFLYVRENYFQFGKWITEGITKKTKQLKWKFVPEDDEILFSDKVDAMGETFSLDVRSNTYRQRAWYKRLARFMPKSAARIWLQVTDIKVERLQEISEEDAKAEGVRWYNCEMLGARFKDYLTDARGYGHPDHDYPEVGSAIKSFETLWVSINGPESWESNPWAWVISFKVLSTTGKPK